MDTPDTPKPVAFGPFMLDLATRTLSAGNEKVTLSSRGFDILALLVAEHGRVVSKDEIIATVWRGLAVEENNLAVQISALRRALAEHADGQTIILTVPGQGYRFVGKLDAPALPPPATSSTADAIQPELSAMLPGIGLAEAKRARRPLSHWSIAVIPVLALAAWLGWQFHGTKEPPRLSIAVLPFRNLSEDRSQDYLADAISDDLTTDLAHLPGSVVIARESSDVYKGHAVPAQQIGRALNVRYLLEGSLRPVENTFSVNAQLIDASNGSHLWATLFEVPRDKLRDAQTAIVGKIGSALDIKLVEIESERSLREHPENPVAVDLYLQARWRHNNAGSLETLTAAQMLLEKALKQEPDYPPASVELSLVLLDKFAYFDDPDEAVDFDRARQLVEKALSNSPSDDMALTASGRVEMLDDHLKAGEERFRSAIDINPSNVVARVGLVGIEFREGRFSDASGDLEKIIRLDPLGAKLQQYHYLLGVCAFMTSRWQDAKFWLRRSLAENVTDAAESGSITEWGNLFLIAALEKSGEEAQAQQLFLQYKTRWANRSVWRLSSYFWKPQVDSAAFEAFRDGLHRVGMPLYADAVQHSQADPRRRGDFDQAPQDIPGSKSINVDELQQLLTKSPAPVILDVGTGSAMLKGSLHILDLTLHSGAIPAAVLQRAKDAPVVVVGAGWLGWSTANAVERLKSEKIGPIFWLRGGEEALAASGNPAVFNGRVP